MQITVGGIPVTIIRKNIKGMHLCVHAPEGSVRLSVPKRMPMAVIEGFLQEKHGWILKQRQKLASLPQPQEHRYESGEPIFVWGQEYRLELAHGGRRNSLMLDGERAILNVREGSTKEQREAYLNEWYRARLKDAVTALLPKWEGITGLHPNEWQTKNMTTRWGTCNTRAKRIWFSIHLAKKPPECLEYVILHELAHLKVPNHGAEFTAILDRHMPHWREVKKRLNESPL